ncbi:hypothetical protein KIL84_013218 [Mauremys mutica]|uniref:Uncharacterized protein n=1 Tax=Mauremys mutica TaxID=74926 RepID=A0A9D4ARW7_9SAUR|nr:hypothetical protein KIL84_013218 [Mauremys mutica]
MLNPVFQPETEPKNQEDFMESSPSVKEEKGSVRKNLLPALEEADSKVEVGMEEEPVYEDMDAEVSSEDSKVESQLIDLEPWKDGNIVTITKPGLYMIIVLVCSKWPSGAEPEAHDEVKEFKLF